MLVLFLIDDSDNPSNQQYKQSMVKILIDIGIYHLGCENCFE